MILGEQRAIYALLCPLCLCIIQNCTCNCGGLLATTQAINTGRLIGTGKIAGPLLLNLKLRIYESRTQIYNWIRLDI